MNNFKIKKKYGQNFLRDDNIIKKIISGANIDKNTLVIEIGPGKGALSKEMISKASFSILYEIDEDLRDYLLNLNVDGGYKVIFGDFLGANVKNDIKDYRYDKLYVIANLPYYITTPIITKFIDDGIFPDKLVIMVQREVADRLSAKVASKDYGSLTVLLNYYYSISILCNVSRNCFFPVPNVDSAVVVMNINNDRLYLKNEDFFKKIVRDSFRFKRKNIKNNLFDYDLSKVTYIFEKYGYNLNDRAEKFKLEFFIELANELCNK